MTMASSWSKGHYQQVEEKHAQIFLFNKFFQPLPRAVIRSSERLAISLIQAVLKMKMMVDIAMTVKKLLVTS